MNIDQKIIDHAKGFIFDCDGTLVDSMPLHMQAWQYAFEQQKVYYDGAFLNSLKGMKETEIVDVYNSKFKTNLVPEEVVLVKHVFFNKQIDNIKPIVPIVNIAKTYHGHKPMAVVSGSMEETVHRELKVVDIYELFDTIITANDPFKPKPDPECFMEAAKRLKVMPRDIVVFEDGDAGIEAAQNAGMMTIDVR